MLKDTELKEWEATGSYLRTEKGNGINVFTKALGNPNASPEKTLLLLHGFPESSFSYHLVLNGLSTYFERIVLFDFPGYGFSDKPKIGYTYSLLEQADIALQVWKSYEITGGHLLAHDMGNSVGTELVAREVEKSLPKWFSNGFKSYTLTNGSIVLEFSELRITQKILLTRFGGLLSLLSNKWLFHNQIKSAHGNAPLSEIEISRLWSLHLQKNGRTVTHHTIKYILDRKRYEAKRWLPALAQTQVPIHLCWGDSDQVAKVEMAHYLKEKICPKAILTVMEGVGHFGQLGSPTIWLKAVLSFFNSP